MVMSDSTIERNVIGEWERPCPTDNCDGSVALLEELEVWLCSEDADHSWPEGHWEVPA
jgi:hypothetical protein